VGEKLDRYELVEVLGVGAFATVWRAHDPVIDEHVAIKVLADNWSRDPGIRQRFLTEAKLALQVTNENLIRVHTVAESADTGTPYIVMALADAGTLRERITSRRLNPHTPHEALEILRDVAIATAALHDNGLIHRDLKPANILFQHTRTGGERLVLGDFGLARSIDRSALTLVAGTPAYAAPEQAAGLGQLTPQVDLYPLGVMLLELITGELPTNNTSMVDTATTTIDIDEALATPSPISVDPETRRLVESLLAKEPHDRPGSAHEVANTITTILGDQQRLLSPAPQAPTERAQEPHSAPTVHAKQPNPTPTAEATQQAEAAPRRSKNLGVIAAATAGLAGLIILAFVLLNNDNNPDQTSAQESTTTTTTQPASPEPSADPTAGADALIPEPASIPTGSTTPPNPNAELVGDFPKPRGATLETALSSGNKRQAYTIASTPEAVIDFYTTGEWTINNQAVDDTATVLELAMNERVVSARIEPLINSSGVSLVRLTITAIT